MNDKNGSTAADLLASSWREQTSPTDLSHDAISSIMPVITSTGASGLAHQRVKHAAHLKESEVASTLKQQARETALRSAMQAVAIESVSGLLAENGIRSLFFKGAAAAHYYAVPECRPVGDIDFLVHPEQEAEARSVISRHHQNQQPADDGADKVTGSSKWPFPAQVSSFDIHSDLGKFDLQPVSAVFDRSTTIEVGNTTIAIPCPEDHLRLLCLHYLIHGGWRSIWLCDVAALLEAKGADFDWDASLGADPITRNWMSIVILLARDLLGADMQGVPRAVIDTTLPGWIPERVKSDWRLPMQDHQPRATFRYTLKTKPHLIFGEVLARWPNPIGATMRVGAPLTDGPRWPHQIRLSISRAFSILSTGK